MQSVSEQNNFVLVDHPRPNVALVTLNRPERMNSMAFDVMVPLKKVLDELTHDNSVRVIVLTGAGRGFSSGADHKSAGSVKCESAEINLNGHAVVEPIRPSTPREVASCRN